jgi:hypothetical protein
MGLTGRSTAGCCTAGSDDVGRYGRGEPAGGEGGSVETDRIVARVGGIDVRCSN